MPPPAPPLTECPTCIRRTGVVVCAKSRPDLEPPLFVLRCGKCGAEWSVRKVT